MIEDEVFKELLQKSPRLEYMLKWRLALGDIKDTKSVTESFRQDWNYINELIKRIEATQEERLK